MAQNENKEQNTAAGNAQNAVSGSGAGAGQHAERDKILEIKNLCMEFPVSHHEKLKALNNISFDIYRGENFGLVGESGCGKTTLGRTIIRLYDPTAGEILFNGKRISGKLDKEARSYIVNHLSMIFQDPISSLNPRMTVEEIIAEGLKTRGMKDKEERRRRVAEILDKVGLLPEHATRYPHEFSGGQRQRIGIARALVLKPEFIIADEPVSALDVSIQAQVINLLMDIKKEMDLTILFIAHDLAVVKYFSDRIGVMCFGNLVELADSDELYAHPIHPYTKALLSAIPQPDPLAEKGKKRLYYDPSMNDYSKETPSFQEIKPGHFVYASASEMEKYRKELGL